MVVTIRAATGRDVPRLAELVQRQVEQQEQLTGSFQLLPGVDWARYVSEKLGRGDGDMLVAEADGVLLGYLDVRVVQTGERPRPGRLRALARRLTSRSGRGPMVITRPRRLASFDDVYVVPDARRRGVARELLEHGLIWARERRAERVEGTILITNRASQELVRSLGFETVRVVVRKQL